MTAAATGGAPADTATQSSGEPRPIVQVRLLGPFEIRLPSGRAAGPWARPTARRLVQLLLLSRDHRIGREEVIELLFPGLGPERAANAVSKALSMARRSMADAFTEIILADRSTIWIDVNVDLRIDLELHEQELHGAIGMPPGIERDDALEQALLRGGRLLDEELYADWAIPRRDHVDQLRRDARLALARDRSAGHGRADPVAVLDAWSGVFSSDPTCEEAAISLMQAFARQGRRDEAVRTYHRCRAALRRLLDTEPSRALEVALDEAQRAPILVRPPTSLEVVSFGREGVLDEMLSHLDRTPVGGGPSLAVLGPAGIGKTHVLLVVRSRLIGQGWRVLHATSIPADAVVPYAAIRTALAPLADRVREGSLLARVMGKGSQRERAGSVEASEQQMVLAGEIADLLDDASSDGPLALVLDDSQWMEPALAAVTARLVSRPAPRGWAILIAARTDEPHAPVPPLASGVIRIDLEPMPAEPLAQVIRDRLGLRVELWSDELRQVVARSGGNPLFAVELGRAHLLTPGAAEASVPETISGLFKSHLAAATREGRSLVPVVALAGDAAPFELVLHVGAQLLGSEPAAIEAIDDLLDQGLLTEDPAGVRLIHPLLRDTALASLNPVRRAALHEALATSIEQIGGDEAGVRSAHHRIAAFMAARLRRHAEAAVREGSAAADAAFEVYAEGPALELYRGVLAAFNALPAADRAPWRAHAVAAWLRVASILTRRYEVDEAQRALKEALAMAETDQERSSAWSGLASIPYRRGDFAAVISLLETGLASLRDGSDLISAQMQVAIAWSKLRDGRTGEATDGLQAALPVLEEAGAVRAVFLCLDYLALALEAAGAHDEAADAWSRAESTLNLAAEMEGEASSRWARHSRAMFVLHRALRPLLMGDATTAVRDLEQALQAYLPLGDRYEMSVAHGLLASAYQMNGDLAAALERWETAATCLEESGHWYHLAGIHASRAGVLEALRRTDEAAAAADLARRIARDDASPQTIDEIEEIISGETIFLSFNRRGLKARATP